MAKKTLVDDLLDAIQSICFHLPWWAIFLVALVPAVGAFFLVAVVISPFVTLIGEGVAAIPLYAALLVYLMSLAAGFSGWKGRQVRKDLVTRTRSLTELRALSWREFEMLVGEFYRQQGYDIAETKGGADGGVDLDGFDPQGKRVLIQCKHWRSAKIGVKIVRETLGVLHKIKAGRAIVIGTGSFTNEAKAFAHGEPIELIEGGQLAAMLSGVEIKPHSGSLHTTASNRRETEPEAHKPSPPEAFMPPPRPQTCPECGGSMVERVARRGANAGNKFLGCGNYPECRYTMNFPQ